MADRLTPEQRHYTMSKIRSVNTKPEIILRRALWGLGFRYKVNDKTLPGKPDIVLPKYRTVVFVHGCFWHGHKGCISSHIPETNIDFWATKIARNQERDQEVWRQLEAKGWAVIIVWECQLKKAALDETINQVEAEIRRNGEIYCVSLEKRRQAQDVWRRFRRQHKETEATHLAELKKM